jgi:Tfp pilus assembly PilM family ATPase
MSLFGASEVVGIDFGHATIRVVSLSAGKKPKFISSAEIAVEPRALKKESRRSSDSPKAGTRECITEAN